MGEQEPKVALVHDELVRRGGAERTLEELVRTFPSADVYALYAGNVPQMTIDGATYPIHVSYLQRFPRWFRRHPGRLLPLLPQAAEQFDLSDYEVVISSASGFAKGIVTRPNIPHICYCHTPTRYLWDAAKDAGAGRAGRGPLRAAQHYLRMVDFSAAQRPDTYIANSVYTQSRIAAYYRRESRVIHPPVDTAFYTPDPREKANASQAPFLVVARLTPAKYIEHAIEVCEKLELPLTIVGRGRWLKRLRNMGGVHTTFAGKVDDNQLRTLYRASRALLQPGIEDFGIAAVEALACGTPVIAYNAGGITDILTRPVFGQLYNAQEPESLAEAVRQFIEREHTFIPETLQEHAMRFSAHRFRSQMHEQVEKALTSPHNTAPWNTHSQHSISSSPTSIRSSSMKK